eukprot:3090354-Rhodomonas_salina.1
MRAGSALPERRRCPSVIVSKDFMSKSTWSIRSSTFGRETTRALAPTSQSECGVNGWGRVVYPQPLFCHHLLTAVAKTEP